MSERRMSRLCNYLLMDQHDATQHLHLVRTFRDKMLPISYETSPLSQLLRYEGFPFAAAVLETSRHLPMQAKKYPAAFQFVYCFLLRSIALYEMVPSNVQLIFRLFIMDDRATGARIKQQCDNLKLDSNDIKRHTNQDFLRRKSSLFQLYNYPVVASIFEAFVGHRILCSDPGRKRRHKKKKRSKGGGGARKTVFDPPPATKADVVRLSSEESNAMQGNVVVASLKGTTSHAEKDATTASKGEASNEERLFEAEIL
eukprot:g440.t1